jgi:CheY-like chemotaxis protein
MAVKGPIMLVEDDRDDFDLIKNCIEELGFDNRVDWYRNGKEALAYLKVTEEQPFIIIADIQMPMMNGLELLKHIYEDDYLRKKSIPFVFLTVVVSRNIVREAYDLMVQGFYQKARNYKDLTRQLGLILNYWTHSLHPNRKIE